MNRKNKIWKFITMCVFIVIVFDPELVGLALFIDAVGLDLFMMLLGVQILTMFGIILNKKIRQKLTLLVFFCTRCLPRASWSIIKETPSAWVYEISGPAMLMYLLVFSVILGVMLNVYK